MLSSSAEKQTNAILHYLLLTPEEMLFEMDKIKLILNDCLLKYASPQFSNQKTQIFKRFSYAQKNKSALEAAMKMVPDEEILQQLKALRNTVEKKRVLQTATADFVRRHSEQKMEQEAAQLAEEARLAAEKEAAELQTAAKFSLGNMHPLNVALM